MKEIFKLVDFDPVFEFSKIFRGTASGKFKMLVPEKKTLMLKASFLQWELNNHATFITLQYKTYSMQSKWYDPHRK